MIFKYELSVISKYIPYPLTVPSSGEFEPPEEGRSWSSLIWLSLVSLFSSIESRDILVPESKIASINKIKIFVKLFFLIINHLFLILIFY